MKIGWPERLLFLFSIIWLPYAFVAYQYVQISDCSYSATDACRAFMHYEPRLILWRAAAIELFAIAIFLWLWKR